MATAEPVHDQLRDTISRLVHRGLGVEDYWRAVSDALDGAVPSEGSCLMTMDPATMLPTAEFVENGMPADAISRLVEIELRQPERRHRSRSCSKQLARRRWHRCWPTYTASPLKSDGSPNVSHKACRPDLDGDLAGGVRYHRLRPGTVPHVPRFPSRVDLVLLVTEVLGHLGSGV